MLSHTRAYTFTHTSTHKLGVCVVLMVVACAAGGRKVGCVTGKTQRVFATGESTGLHVYLVLHVYVHTCICTNSAYQAIRSPFSCFASPPVTAHITQLPCSSTHSATLQCFTCIPRPSLPLHPCVLCRTPSFALPCSPAASTALRVPLLCACPLGDLLFS